MNSYLIDRIVKALGKSVRSPEAAARKLHEAFQDTDAVTWSVEDVLSTAESMKRVVTEDEAREVLHEALRKHDAEIGITWDTFAAYLTDFPKKEG